MRCNGNRKLLPGMRGKETGTKAKLDLCLRCNDNRQFLSGMRGKETGRLDLQLWRGQQRKLLSGVRRKETGINVEHNKIKGHKSPFCHWQ